MRTSRPARKRFGQHFLETAWADKVARAIAAEASDTIVEIGPGRGALTTRLCTDAGRVIACEIDRDLAADLERDAPPNLTVLEGDFLDVDAARLRALASSPAGLRIAGNLPYNVASPILFKIAELRRDGLVVTDATVMLQREVADRLLAEPGSRDYGVLTVLIRHTASVQRVLQLPPGAFRPAPKVHSTVVRLRYHDAEPPVADTQIFAAITQAMFTQRRKTLSNALAVYAAAITAGEALRRGGIDPRRRPETLSIAEIAALSDVYAAARRSL